MTVRVRFAPSPTGMLHLGSLRTALYNYLFARKRNGKFILRIEDTDQNRLVDGATEKLLEALDWIGITPDEGPSIGGKLGPYKQSERLELYEEGVHKLLQKGHAYHCFCSERRLDLVRKAAIRAGETPKYDNNCRFLTSDDVKTKLKQKSPYVVRLKVERDTEEWNDAVFGPTSIRVTNEGDPVLLKSDGWPTYHLANVIDDHYMDISHVLRGSEWQTSTGKHLSLYKAFDWSPPTFAHLPLLINESGGKLSKRHGAGNIEDYKNRGYFPEAVTNLALSVGATFSSANNTGLTLTELAELFDLDSISNHNCKLDLNMIDDLNRIHLQRKLADPYERDALARVVTKLVTEILETQYCKVHKVCLERSYIETVLSWAQTRIHRLNDLVSENFLFLWTIPKVLVDPSDLHGNTLTVLLATMDKLEGVSCFGDISVVNSTLRNIAAEVDLKIAFYMKLLRLAISGLQVGPPVAEMMMILGKDITIQRLSMAANLCKTRRVQN